MSFLYRRQYKSRAGRRERREGGQSLSQTCAYDAGLPSQRSHSILPPSSVFPVTVLLRLPVAEVCVHMCLTHTHTQSLYTDAYMPPKLLDHWEVSNLLAHLMLLLPYLLWSRVHAPSPFSAGSLICYVSAKINSTLISGGFGVYCWKKGYLLAVTEDSIVRMHSGSAHYLNRAQEMSFCEARGDFIHPNGLQPELYALLHHLPASLIWDGSHGTVYPEGRRYSQLRALSLALSFFLFSCFSLFFSS